MEDKKSKPNVFSKFSWYKYLTTKGKIYTDLFNEIKKMSSYLNLNEYYLSWKIISIKLLYYDDLTNENEYYNKIYDSIGKWFSRNLLISNRIKNLDECLKDDIFSKIYDKRITYTESPKKNII